MKRNLPPLNALRAFEASARLGSMQRAAHELNVTPSAVSQQVQNLEQWVGFPLLDRRARQVQANAEGRAYLAAVSAAFDQIAAATEELSARRVPSDVNSVACCSSASWRASSAAASRSSRNERAVDSLVACASNAEQRCLVRVRSATPH